MMYALVSNLYSLRRKGSTIFLAFSLFSGLMLGILLFCRIRYSSFLLMRSSFYSTVSIVAYLFGFLLPFILSACAALLHLPLLIYFICFFRSFLFSFTSLLIYFSFQPAGLFFRHFLLFGGFVSFPLLFFSWLTYLRKNNDNILVKSTIVVFAGILIGLFDYYLITPCLVIL